MDAIKNMLGMGGDAGPGRVTTAPWGSFNGTDAQLYTITNGGITAAVTDLGATLVQLLLPDKNGEVRPPRPGPTEPVLRQRARSLRGGICSACA
eukprot:COSAG02_NODE_235_length_27784_cov_9.895828_8_plen_94_part_00